MLNKIVYPVIQHHMIVYTNICAFQHERYKNIDLLNDGIHFCGNVIQYSLEGNTSCQFNYFDYDLVHQLHWLSLQGQHDLMLYMVDEYKRNRPIAYEKQAKVLDYCFIAHYYNKNLEQCMHVFAQFYKYEISNHIRSQSDFVYHLFREQGYTIVGTCNPQYEPKEKEVVVYYGQYPDDYMALPQSTRIYKHISKTLTTSASPSLHNSLQYGAKKVDRFLCDPCWDTVDQIFIMGLETEVERMQDTLLQLAQMHCPLDRVYMYKAKKDGTLPNKYIGATKNHLDCLQVMLENGWTTCLFLEDDFTFTSTVQDNQRQLSTFFARDYDYDVCFLAASKMWKRLDYDDLLIRSKQACTTSSGYLVHKKNVQRVYDTVLEGYQLLLQNPTQSHQFCIDRYWARLSNIYIFKRKLGFQKPMRSCITGMLNDSLD